MLSVTLSSMPASYENEDKEWDEFRAKAPVAAAALEREAPCIPIRTRKPVPSERYDAPIFFSEVAALQLNRLAIWLGVPRTEIVRRGLLLLDAYLQLRGDEELVIRNRRTGSLERLNFTWEK